METFCKIQTIKFPLDIVIGGMILPAAFPQSRMVTSLGI